MLSNLTILSHYLINSLASLYSWSYTYYILHTLGEHILSYPVESSYLSTSPLPFRTGASRPFLLLSLSNVSVPSVPSHSILLSFLSLIRSREEPIITRISIENFPMFSPIVRLLHSRFSTPQECSRILNSLYIPLDSLPHRFDARTTFFHRDLL